MEIIMVKYINKSYLNVGNMYSIKGVVIHNDAGSIGATAEWYVNWLASRNPALGIAHYYIDRHAIVRVVDTYKIAYHCGDGVSPTSGNGNYIGYEVCQSMGASVADFLANEDMALRQVAEDMLFYKLPVNRDTVRLHREFVPTSCLPVKKTELLTKNGWVSLEDVQVGDEIATYRLDDGEIIFDKVQHKVPIHEKDTWKFRDVEVTADHNMLWKAQKMSKYKLTQAKDMFSNKEVLTIPNAGNYSGEGLPITNSFLKLLVATQADGHYMRRSNGKLYGLEFHFSKQRKVDAVIEILDDEGIEYSHTHQEDGSQKIRVYDASVVHSLEEYLDNKKFSWKFLELSKEQAELFLDTILDFDGCRAGNDYSSRAKENIDIVQAIAGIHGVGTRMNGDSRVCFTNSYRTVPSEGKLSTSAQRKPKQLVSCVTVNTGLILIRQYGRTTVVGNCPHRSIELHGNSINALKDYFIGKIKHYQSLGKTVDEMLANENKPKVEAKPTATLTVRNINQDKLTYDAVLTNIKAPNGVREVLFPTWTNDKGQDDIIWHKATKQPNGEYVYTVKASEHKNEQGIYVTHAYIVSNSGAKFGVGAYDLYLNKQKPTGKIEITKNIQAGTFTVKVTGVTNPNGVKQVKLPTWTEVDNQDDLKWYVADKQPDGSYTKTINIKDHKNGLGRYIVHGYVVQKNDQLNAFGGTDFIFNDGYVPKFHTTTTKGVDEVTVYTLPSTKIKHVTVTEAELNKFNK